MSMQELTEALNIIAENRSRGFFAGPRDPALIMSAEAVLGRPLPPEYRGFVLRLGAGSFGACEIYGVTNANFENGKIPNGIWLTLKQRRAKRLPDNFIVIGDTGDGDYYCIELQEGKEGRIVVYQPGIPSEKQQLEEVSRDFGAFLLSRVREQL